jgi:hypothetical protein
MSAHVITVQVLSRNAATVAGGGIFWRGFVELVDCTIQGNTAGLGD